MSIITEVPSWFILLCLTAGIIYAGALYLYDKFNKTYGARLAGLLATLRFLSVTLLAFFLMKPLIKSIQKTVEKPIILVAQDNSESLAIGKDSAFYKNQYPQQLQTLINQFGEDYDVRPYTFGDKVEQGVDTLNYSEKFTDFSNLLEEIYTTYSGRNLGAIIIASDGLYNRGSNPVYSYKKLNVPVYSIALGDTTIHKDVLLAEVAANRLAYLNNRFPIEITVEGRKAAGETATLTVSRKGNVLFSESIVFNGERFFKTIPITLNATEVGLQKYSIDISPVGNEVTLVNNHKDVFIDVLDSRQKVLILAQAPHPDLNAVRDAIISNESYKVDVQLAKDFSGNINDYNLVFFHQLPGIGGNGSSLITNALEKNIPSVFIWGGSTDFSAFNKLNTGYSLEEYRNSLTEVGASYAEEFSLYTLSSPTSGMFKTLPPLSMPFGNYGFSPGATSIVYQQIGQIKMKKPLISFNKLGDTKVALIAGEGLWRWKYAAFQQFESHDNFNELITKLVQYMASKEDKSLFRVSGKNDFYENENIIFNAELYNQSYEPITNREIAMRIQNDIGDEFTYNFSPIDTRYRLDAGKLPVGNYTYEATTNSDQGILKQKGEFSISALQLELINTIADHRLMYQFAKDNNGEMVYPDEMNKLPELIKNKKEIVSIAYENKRLDDLINYKWLLLLPIGLLGIEWLLRKRAGTY